MSYLDNFKLVEDMLKHLDTVVSSLDDDFLKSRYAGFMSVSAATVYELSIKSILIDFAQKKHESFGAFVQSSYNRLNGRITVSDLKGMHLGKFGAKYKKKFTEILGKKEDETVVKDKVSIISSYENVLTWRHQFAHGGVVPGNATYEEVRKAYFNGKLVINCFAESLNCEP